MGDEVTPEMYRELLQRAYRLLEDISHPFRNVERYHVKKWLEDAKPIVESRPSGPVK